jgi:dienelactone hydrolase
MNLLRNTLFLLTLWFTAYTSKASNFHPQPVAGPYKVGFRVVQQYDRARVYKPSVDLTSGTIAVGERARPIQTLIWYPAKKASGRALHYGDYVRLAATETEFTRSPAEVDQFLTAALAENYANLDSNQRRVELAQPMLAAREADEVPQQFPVLIYAPGSSSSAYENADLCEYLASQGYLVLASPSLGVNTRSITLDLEGAEAQAHDISFLVGYAATLAQADKAKLAVIGYSYGGLANVLAAAQDDRIAALVALDGSVRYYSAVAQAATYATPERLAVPLLYLGAKPITVETILNRSTQTASYSLLNQLKYADFYNVTMYPMEHAAFQSESLRLGPEQRFGEYTRQEAALAYGWMEQYVLAFLNAYLKGEAGASKFLNNAPKANGVPAHLLSVEVHRSQGAPPTLPTLAAAFAKQHYTHLADLYRAMTKMAPSFKPAERALISWGEPFLEQKRYAPAIEIYELVTALYPDSPRAAFYLALAYERNNDRAHAIENYQRVLSFWPDFSDAKESIIRLRAQSPSK